MRLKDISIEKKLSAGFVFSIILMIMFSFFLYRSKVLVHQHIRNVNTVAELRIQVKSLLIALNRLEIDRKRYLLANGRVDSLDYKNNVSQFSAEFNKFRKFIKRADIHNRYIDSVEVNTLNELSKFKCHYHLSFDLQKDLSEILKTEENRFDKISNYLHLIDDEYEHKSQKDFEEYMEKSIEGNIHILLLLMSSVIITVLYFSAMMRDVKKKKNLAQELEQSRNDLYTIIDTVPALVFVKDKKKKFALVNKYFLDFFNTTQEKILHKGSSDLVKNQDQWITDEEDEAIITNKIPINNIEREIQRKDGKSSWLAVNKAPLFNNNGEVSGLVGVMNEITKVVEFQNSLIEARKELEELNKQKNKFFSIIAHDLRGPFSGLLGVAEYLASDFDTLSATEKNEILREINFTIKNLWELVNNLLAWSRIQFERVIFSPDFFYLEPVVSSVFKALSISSDNKKIALKADFLQDLKVYADINMIETVIRNLVNNAIKYTNPGGCVTVSANECEKGIQLSIADNGIGMSKEMSDNLFRMDVKVSRTGTANEKGTGLGLLICEEFVRKHRSTITVKSEVDKGTTMSFMLSNPEH
ncbi:MAG: PAS domain-containing sensor histidine kinase [Bacteroidota bacterium]|nr:PAS domain-containing sensor histidine kinase [Bacteroidota bacterium]